MPRSVLFVFAHQDDEMAAVSRIAFERSRGARVVCHFLTDGSGGGVAANVRNDESRAVLSRLGVDRIAFIGTEVPIRDGHLVEHLDLALDRMERDAEGLDFDAIYCLAWEGGHHDHDASHLIAAAFANRRDRIDRCYELPLYRGSKIFGGLFRVFSPTGDEWEERRLTFREGLRYALLARHYRSQRSSWIGLFPETSLKLALLRLERWRFVSIARLREAPHRRPLLYERRFRFPYERFSGHAVPFIEKHFPSRVGA